MALIDIKNIANEKTGEVELNDAIYAIKVKKHILHDVVKMQLAKRRSGTSSVKNRGDITGSTRKLYRQKGTGNSRAGSIKSPLRRGGGVIFGPVVKSYEYKLPKKVSRLGLKMALSAKLNDNAITIIDKFDFSDIKTKNFINFMNSFDFKSALVVYVEENENLELSLRNVKNTKLLKVEGLNVFDILKYDNLILLESSVQGIEKRLV